MPTCAGSLGVSRLVFSPSFETASSKPLRKGPLPRGFALKYGNRLGQAVPLADLKLRKLGISPGRVLDGASTKNNPVPIHRTKKRQRSLSVIQVTENKRDKNGGEGGIRTHGARKGSTVFETARFNRSRTSPYPSIYHICLRSRILVRHAVHINCLAYFGDRLTTGQPTQLGLVEALGRQLLGVGGSKSVDVSFGFNGPALERPLPWGLDYIRIELFRLELRSLVEERDRTMTSAATLSPWASSLEWGENPGQVDAQRQIARQQMDRDRALVEQCLNGSDGAWEELVRSHTRLVYGSCYRFTGRADDSSDLTQDVFIRVFRSLHTFDPGSGAFRTWLIRVTRNLLIDHYRKTRKDQALDPIEDQLYALEQSGVGSRADGSVVHREAKEVLQQGLAKLSPDLREAVILRDLQEMEYREIGNVLNIPEGTVKSRINRGRRELAKNLKAMGVQP